MEVTDIIQPGQGERKGIENWLKGATQEEIITAIINSGRDPLTGLLNRRGGLEEIERVKLILEANKHELAKAGSLGEEHAGLRLLGVASIQIYAMDLSGFKGYNDKFGQEEGDKMLKKFAGGMLQTFHRSTDICMRWGGDEFLVIVFNSKVTDENVLAAEKAKLDVFLGGGVSTYVVLGNLAGDKDILKGINGAFKELAEVKKVGPVDSTGRSTSGGFKMIDLGEING
ncbi:hypothetical protein A2210_02265 [Candidatus Woesebacteria bacterium RIFOXYA1_FULL_40_18]|uniref:GGDEF domain-containing protein n=3 Tax=Candidatus Woeseibacteriota TaxID=1752722 RepID=A0A0G0SLX8_9BACT|nr:MAG: hypothetical protein UU03_C0005G0002 [Candidatus Woesebacteria bacterium GW2011_GWA1_40_45]OGM75832.1 MAG: hypothetical protein A2210_02265 [Candidatus Woesebacteria bacterium RIFOXYA1_FULL_40_18]OGM86950.1 MAG: hypothetical protein A2614_00090 [Candidatus Woesebacteria bacterium RIFOXYD1_FULL_40_21]